MTTNFPKLPINKLQLALMLFMQQCPSLNGEERELLKTFIKFCEERVCELNK